MSQFTPVTGLLGGSLIGTSAAILLLVNGDILGLSGIFSSSLLHPFKTAQEQPRRFIFLAFFFSAAAIYVNVVDPNSIAQSQKTPSTLAYLLGGFLVGFLVGFGCSGVYQYFEDIKGPTRLV